MRPGDFVILNDTLGCVQSLLPLCLLCQDGVTRQFQGTPEVIVSGQEYALLIAEKVMGRIRNGNQKVI